MNRYNLSKRLEKVANLVEPAAFLVDIGCDHGFMAIDLVKSGKVKKALCTDINEGPLKRAKDHIKEYGLEKEIDTCLSDGLISLKEDFNKYNFDSCTICGMGGLMGVKIIFEADEFFRRMNCFYLQLQSDIELVRLFLEKSGYEILFEDMVFEDSKYYTVMKVKNKENRDISSPVFCDVSFDNLPYELKRIFESLNENDSVKYKYPYYEGMDKETYEKFLLFMIDKYTKIDSYLPKDSDRIPVINKERKIMELALDLYKEKNNVT